MRRFVSLLARGGAVVALAAGGAALSAPPAQAATCSAYTSAWQAIGNCLPPGPVGYAWYVTAQCFQTGHPPTYITGPTKIGPGLSVASCPTTATAMFPTLHYIYIPIPPSGPTGTVVNLFSGKCLDVYGGFTADGTAVQVYSCNGTASQSWQVATDQTMRAFGKCLATVGGGVVDHTLVELRTCNGTASQKWAPQANGSLLNPGSGKCLDELGFNAADHAPLGLWTCNGLSNQHWTFPHA
jgi:hypothetical protein